MAITTIQATIIWMTGILLAALIARDYLRNKVDLVSIRNIMLAGFIVYQILSPASTLYARHTEKFLIVNLANAGWQFIALMYTFLISFIIAYQYGWGAKYLSKRFPMYSRELTDQSILLAALVGAGVSILLRQTPPIPGVIYSAYFISSGLATASTGLVAWWWMKKNHSLLRFAIASGLAFSNLLIVTSGSFSRRPIISVTLILVWVIYYSKVRYTHNRVKILLVLSISLLPLVILGSLLTSARHHDIAYSSGLEIIQQIFREGNISEGVEDMLGGQLVGEASLWCVENFPEQLEQDPLLSLRYYFVGNIPRALWEDKPYVLSTRIASLADIEGVRQDRDLGGQGVTLPPGVIGYTAAEGGIYAAILYGLIIGIAARFLDDLVVQHAYRIGVIIPIAASLGNVLGFLRGDLATFATAATWSIIASFCFIFLFTVFFGQRSERPSIHIS